MLQRMHYMLDHGFVHDVSALQELMERYEEVVQKASTARLTIMKYNLAANPELLSVMAKELRDMLALESDLLGQLQEMIVQ
ncbi:hypothetical protein D3C84_812500 [compost metagenome]